MPKTVVGLVSVALLILTGCGKKPEEKIAEKIIEQNTGGKAKVDITDQSVKVETEEGTMNMTTGKSAKIPESFPSDIYIFKPAEVKMAMEVGQGYSVALATGKEIDAVASAYKKEMVKRGWKQQAAMDMGENAMLIYEKEKRVTNVAVTREEGETKIVLTVGMN